jgi:hypothetical protein
LAFNGAADFIQVMKAWVEIKSETVLWLEAVPKPMVVGHEFLGEVGGNVKGTAACGRTSEWHLIRLSTGLQKSWQIW